MDIHFVTAHGCRVPNRKGTGVDSMQVGTQAP